MNSQSIRRRLRMLLVFNSLVFLVSLGWNQPDPGILESSDRIHQSFEAETCFHLHIPTALASQQYVVHEPITITNNADFAAFGFPGDGSPNNPYVIECLNITSDALPLIHVENTTMYFRIQNNLLNGLIGTYDIILGMMYVREGISLVHVTHGTIDSNIVINCGETGISLETSEQNILSNNNVSNCGIGISLGWSHQNTFSNNTISHCGIGISLMVSGQNSFVRNHLINNGFFILPGHKHYFQATVTDNEVNGRPLAFWQNVQGGTIPPGAGQIVLINSTRIEVTGQDLTRVTVGVMALFSSHLHIHHNNISNNSIAGIHLYNSGNITFAYNTFSHCTKGILLDYSGNSTLNNNIFCHCKFGIIFGASAYNTLTHNIFSNNTYGLFLSSTLNTLLSYNIFSDNRDYGLILGFISWNNIIKANDFLGNNPGGRSQAYDNGTNNVFAHNYWDDHDSTDQNSDGIADTPYPIDGEVVNQDLYPLMARANPTVTLPPLGSFPPSRGTVSLLFATLFLAMSSMRGIKRKKRLAHLSQVSTYPTSELMDSLIR